MLIIIILVSALTLIIFVININYRESILKFSDINDINDLNFLQLTSY